MEQKVFSIEGKEFSISARDRDEMVRFLSNALYAEPLLFLDGDVVDYVYEGISFALIAMVIFFVDERIP